MLRTMLFGLAAPFVAFGSTATAHQQSLHKGRATSGTVVSFSERGFVLGAATGSVPVTISESTKFERDGKPAAIRFTGMPGWGGSDDENWKLVLFVRHLPELTAKEEEELMKEINGLDPARGTKGGADDGAEGEAGDSLVRGCCADGQVLRLEADEEDAHDEGGPAEAHGSSDDGSDEPLGREQHQRQAHQDLQQREPRVGHHSAETQVEV